MLIITDSENILERLRISLSIGDDKLLIDSGKCIADATILNLKKNQFMLASTEVGYLILMGRDFSEDSQKLIAKCTHQVIVQSGKIKLLILKTDVNSNDNTLLKNIISKVKDSWYSLWHSQFEKTLNLSESISRSERKAKLEKWLHIPNIDVALVSFDDPNLHKNICTFFNIKPIGFINQIYTECSRDHDVSCESLDNDGVKCNRDIYFYGHELSSKPPALNWTPFPRYSEVQVALKYKILKGCLAEDMFRLLISLAEKSYNWEYKYEWINGILLREDVIKVTITRNDVDDEKFLFLEIAGRVDKDELDEDYHVPMKAIWPNLARVIKSTFTFFEKYDTIPYIMNLLLIGDIFFENDDKDFKIEARSVDMVQSFTSIERLGKIAFRAHDRTWLLNLSQIFPDIHPICDADLWKTRLMTFSTDNEKKDIKNKNELSSHTLTTSKKEIKISNETTFTPQTSALLNVTSHKNRGRKVSFGGISSFPVLSTENKLSLAGEIMKYKYDTSSNDKDDFSHCKSIEVNEKNERQSNNGNVSNSIHEFVDDILSKVMNNILNDKND
uniref:Recep_L_domain domain-containing protein n=1 Tax=Strongyloides papillosus TaxID=174720 RepID=A0A0N5BUC6_STREA